MTIGNALFSRLTTDQFSRMQTGISDLQDRIASGKNDPRPSADPVRALRLSAVTELRSSIDRFAQNAGAASDRLALTDTVLGEVSNVVRQIRELAIQAVNSTMPEEGIKGLATEAMGLRAALFSAANTRDAAGQPLFAGYGSGDAFVETDQGVRFVGDAGRSSLRVSESMTVATSLNGADVFSTGQNGQGLFDLVDDMIASMTKAVRQTDMSVGTETGFAMMQVPAVPGEVTFGFDLKGPAGTVSISVPMVAGVPGPMIDAINATAAESGVTASLADDGVSIRLAAVGQIALTNGARSDDARAPVVTVLPVNSSGDREGSLVSLRPDRLSVDRIMEGLTAATDNLAASRAEAGALARITERQTETLSARKLQVDLSVANLEEVDMAAAVTKLQSLLMSQEAAQQSFVRIRSTGLFDYLR